MNAVLLLCVDYFNDIIMSNILILYHKSRQGEGVLNYIQLLFSGNLIH